MMVPSTINGNNHASPRGMCASTARSRKVANERQNAAAPTPTITRTANTRAANIPLCVDITQPIPMNRQDDSARTR